MGRWDHRSRPFASFLWRALSAVALGLVWTQGVAPGGEWDGWRGARVKRVEFHGNHHLTDDQLEQAVYTEASGRFGFGKTERLDVTEFEADRLRVRVAYKRHGFPHAQVRASIRGDAQDATVAFDIVEGRAVFVDSVRVHGWPLGVRFPEAFRPPLPLTVGQRMDEAAMQQAAHVLRDTLAAAGYWRGALESRWTRRDSVVVVHYTCEPGPLFVTGAVDAVGRGSVPEWLVEEAIHLEPGQPFDERLAKADRRRLAQLQLFRSVAYAPEAAGDTVSVVFQLERGAHRLGTVGVGYGTEEQLRGRLGWTDRNFLGGARRLELAARGSKLGLNAHARLVQPRLPVPPYRVEAIGRVAREFEDTHDLSRQSLELWVKRPIGAWTEVGVGVVAAAASANIKVEEAVIDDQDQATVTDVRARLVRDTSVDPLSPRPGSRLAVTLRYADQGLLSDFNFATAELDARRYVALGKRRLLALRGAWGVALPRGASPSLPVWERLHGGGSTHLRAFGRRTLGPTVVVGDEVTGLGGEARGLVVAGLRVPVVGPVGAAFFVEGGNVWEKVAQVVADDLEWGVGGGIRFKTPVGPFRLDAGTKLSPVPGLKSTIVHISIGESF